MKRSIAIVALAGLLAAILLIGYHGFLAVSDLVLAVGWGLLAVGVYHLIPLTFSSLAWRRLVRNTWRKPLSVFIWARLVREAVANLLPVLQVGGELVGARILTFRGAVAGLAGASVVVDLTLEAVAQFFFTLLGLVLLVMIGGSEETVRWTAAGLAVAALALGGFVIAQHNGMFKWLEGLVEKIADRWNWLSLGRIGNVHDMIQKLYRERRALFAAGLTHFFSWIISAGEVWLALYFMGSPVTFLEALILESLSYAIRSAAFMVPGALGVQEGTYMLLGQIFGLTPETGLALSLVKRVRDLLLGIPTLLGWQMQESRRLWVRANGAKLQRD
ncbi:MAG TPA: lysylphosphatidylglycerol synthase domain-containing protein [Burkholderiales bacterium]|nr:lysylphosphatidylglycerol synthase domain-containing protein [Burkholderiales bacterium]